MWGWLKGTPPKAREVVEAERAFSKEELLHIAQQFKAAEELSAGSQQHAGTLPSEVFLERVCGLPTSEPVSQALLATLRRGRAPEQGVTLDDVVLAKACCERMGEDDAYQFSYDILVAAAAQQAELKDTPSTSGRPFDMAALQHGITACTRLVFGRPAHAPIVAAAASGAYAQCSNGSTGGVGGQGVFTVDMYRRWSKVWPAVHTLLSSLLKGVGKLELQPLQPQGRPAASAQASEATTEAGGGSAGTVYSKAPWYPCMPTMAEVGYPASHPLLLKPFWAWMLSSCLVPSQRQHWRCLFNSDKNGKSFNTMISCMSSCQGPSLLLVRDKGGYVFGGYAPAPWVKNGNFYGDSSAFIFNIHPAAQLFRATGANKNYLWCGVGFSQLPNGIGFGGPENAAHAGNFGLYVDSTCDQGMSRPIATYGTVASLASSQVFQVDTVECWQLQPNEDEESGSEDPQKKKSILDKSAQDRAVLDLAGMNVNHSAGLRAEPIEE